MTYNITNTDEMNFSEYDFHIMKISWMTGLSGSIIKDSYENSVENMTDVEILLSGLERRYDFSQCGDNPIDILFFVKNTICFPDEKLKDVGADNEYFFQNMTLEESLVIIISRIIKQDDRIPSKDGFPEEFIFQFNQNGRIQRLENGRTWFPFINVNRNRLPNSNRLLISIQEQTNVDLENGFLLFHGTSWNNAIEIMGHVRATSRKHATDFGFENFYTTDIFHNSLIWAKNRSQAAVVIFYFENDFFDNLNFKDLSDIDRWKNVVFRCRNPPRRSFDSLAKYRGYKNFLEGLDSLDLVFGPIFANPKVKNLNEVRYIQNQDGVIPYQYLFKRSSVEMLDDKILTTLFINDTEI